MIHTVADLIRELEDMNSPDAPVRIASVGNHNAFAYGISTVVADADEDGAIYIGEGNQIGYLSGDVRRELSY